MSLVRAFSSSVPPKIRNRGTEYASNGLVTLTTCNGERVEAIVSGTEDYHVALKRNRSSVSASCTCPFYSDRSQVCKHIWATILKADEEGGLRGPRGGLPKFLEDTGSGWDDERD